MTAVTPRPNPDGGPAPFTMNTASFAHTLFKEDSAGLYWRASIPLVKNPLLWRELLIALSAPLVLIALIVIVFARGADAVRISLLFFCLFLLFIIAAFLVLFRLSRSLGGGFNAAFFLDHTGVGFEAGDYADRLRTGTLILAFLSGAVHAAVPTLSALSVRENFISWHDVKKTRIHASHRAIYIWSKEDSAPITLYCPAEVFERAAGIITKNVPGNAAGPDKNPHGT